MANESGLSLGTMGRLLAGMGAATNVLSVPVSAIVEEEGIPVLFVQLSGETFEKRDIVIGIQDAESAEIKSGLEEGERVVIDGAYALLLSTRSGTIPAHGHAH
jgi:multidrug efflux pump subunit AcrA (membrane-fusion protein)